MFVRDLDTSLLGQNANGLEQFECLRKCTDELVNAILHVRQLLKRRRFEGMLIPLGLITVQNMKAYFVCMLAHGTHHCTKCEGTPHLHACS